MKKTFDIKAMNKDFLNDRKTLEQGAIKRFKKVDGTVTKYAIVYANKMEMYSINDLQFVPNNRIMTNSIDSVNDFCDRLSALGFKEI